MRNEALSVITKHVTIIVPVHNEEEVLPLFYRALRRVIAPLPYSFDVLFVNDGSRDASGERVAEIAARDDGLKYIEFSRNFGKEAATSAGLHAAEGDAAILIDADLQHPVELIPQFLDEWESGAQIVVGRRVESRSDSPLKRAGSRVFNRVLTLTSETAYIPNVTDYRLLDRTVIEEFKKFTEHERVTRNLIDWLGFPTSMIPFEARERAGGSAQYSVRKLARLAIVGLTTGSLLPLKLAGYLGVAITLLTIPIGIVMFVDHYVYSLGFHFSGSVMLGGLLLFLIGIVLVSLGLLAVYIGHIFEEARNRPMYVVSKKLNV